MKSLRPLVALFAVVVLAAIAPGAAASAQSNSTNAEVIIAIDTSGSMRPVIDAAKAAAVEFVSAMPTEVRIGVATFADDVTVLSPPTTDRALLVAQIDSITADGDTALYDAVVAARQGFDPTAEHRVLVLFSDGGDEGSAANLQDAMTAVDGVHVEAISLTTSESDLQSLSALGPVTSAEDVAGVSAAFARVAGLVVEVLEPVAPASSSAPPDTAPQTSIAPTSAAVAPGATSPPTEPGTSPATASAMGSSVSLWIGAAGVFAGLFLIALLCFPGERVSRTRLGTAKPRRASDIGTRATSAIDEALVRHGKRSDLGTTLAVAGISMPPAEFVATVGVVSFVAGLVGLLLGGPVVAISVAAAVCLAVRVHVGRAKARRQAAFADQLPDVLQLITTALRSGFGITQAIESVAEESEEPARGEFAHVLVESRLGRDLSESMYALARRMESKDLEWVVAAIDINRETGGNLSEVLNTVSATIRERGRIARHVRTLTAEGRLSARILIALPIVMLLWQWRVSPDNFDLLTYGVGLVALATAGVLMAVGIFWVHRIVNSVAL